jgi:hypothetical protein
MASGKSIIIPCKPYVKQFLIQNFGYPVNLYSVANPFSYLFRTYLTKPILLENEKAKKLGRPRQKIRSCFSDSQLDVPVEFVLSDHDFYSYGWEMHPLHVRALNTTFEQSAKLFMRTCITIDTLMSGSLAASIRRFQDRYNYPEEVWSFQSIKKDIDRNTTRIEIDFDTDIYEKIQKILLHNLYKLGTLSKNNHFSHEYNHPRHIQHRRISQNMADPLTSDRLDSE